MTRQDMDWQHAHGIASVELAKAKAEIERLRAALTDIVGLTEGYADADDLMDTLCGTAKAALEQKAGKKTS